MKVFAMDGFAGSEKETLIEQVVKELKKRNHTVGLVWRDETAPPAGGGEPSPSGRCRYGGADPVARIGGDGEMALYRKAADLDEILRFFDQEYVLLADQPELNGPRIVTWERFLLEEEPDPRILAVVGDGAGDAGPSGAAPWFFAAGELDALVSRIEAGVFEKLPDFPPKCCSSCGYSCRELCAAILRGEAKRSDCVVSVKTVSIWVDGEELLTVPFVQRLLNNAVRAVAGELEGYRENGIIEIRLGGGACLPDGGS